MASPIMGSGLASGIDTGSLLAQLLQIQRRPIQVLQSKKSAISQKAAKLSDLTTKLKELGAAADKLDSVNKVLKKGATSSNIDVATASATGSAANGQYTLSVSSLATAEKNRSAGYASGSSVVPTGTISITVGGSTKEVELTGGATSLAEVVSKINGADAGVTATLVNDGQGGAESYSILLTAKETGYDSSGAASDAVIIDSGTTGLGFTEVATATNATFTLDGLPDTFTRRANQFSDLIPGVTFSLQQAGTSTVEIKTDNTAVKDALQSFVDAYNAVLGALNKEQKVTKDTNRATSLSSETSVGLLRRALGGVVTSDAGDTGGPFNTLASIGISQTKSGTLSIDGSALDAALATNGESAAGVFATSGTGVAARIDELVERFSNSVDGVLTQGSKTLNKLSSTLTSRIDTLEERSSSYEDRLRKQFTAMERTIAMVQSQGNRFAAMMAGF